MFVPFVVKSAGHREVSNSDWFVKVWCPIRIGYPYWLGSARSYYSGTAQDYNPGVRQVSTQNVVQLPRKGCKYHSFREYRDNVTTKQSPSKRKKKCSCPGYSGRS